MVQHMQVCMHRLRTWNIKFGTLLRHNEWRNVADCRCNFAFVQSKIRPGLLGKVECTRDMHMCDHSASNCRMHFHNNVTHSDTCPCILCSCSLTIYTNIDTTHDVFVPLLPHGLIRTIVDVQVSEAADALWQLKMEGPRANAEKLKGGQATDARGTA